MESAHTGNTEYVRFFYEGLAEPVLGDSPSRIGVLNDGVMEYGVVEDNSEEATRREGLEPGALNSQCPVRSLGFFLFHPLNRIPDKLAGIIEGHLLLDVLTIGLHGLYAQVQFFCNAAGSMAFAVSSVSLTRISKII